MGRVELQNTLWRCNFKILLLTNYTQYTYMKASTVITNPFQCYINVCICYLFSIKLQHFICLWFYSLDQAQLTGELPRPAHDPAWTYSYSCRNWLTQLRLSCPKESHLHAWQLILGVSCGSLVLLHITSYFLIG